MKICIIHGSPRKGNTYKAVSIFKEELQKCGEVEFIEYFLPKDMPHFCCGCFSCFDKGEDKCPHVKYIQPITDSMRESDGLIFSSPVYVLAESGQIKAFLDHFGYLYMPHRPMEEMFSKVAMVISTTAGAGTGNAIKTISRSLRYWGVKRILKCGFTIFAKNWDDMKQEKQQKFKNTLCKKAKEYYKITLMRKKLSPRLFTRFLFRLMKGMISGYPDLHPDKEYWKKKGWIKGISKPF